jgi:hypothetical protein
MEDLSFRAQFRRSKMTSIEARKLVKLMAGYYRVTPPTLRRARQGKDGYSAWQNRMGLTINLDRAAWSPILLAHEMAHWICYKKDWNYEEGHGPEWLRVYIDILDRVKIVPAEAMMGLCRKYGLKVKRGEL